MKVFILSCILFIDLTAQVSDLKNSERIATDITSPGRLSPFGKRAF